ncbi:hypothetical protein V865_001258 [Kwoniella europaea PYCC6329]|uniref:UBC core domain-containing protein n=1 Tax=Kwoniella europaea PYCC6329 TaxID=1423913 RepID=A0AAX4KBE7_9TREE
MSTRNKRGNPSSSSSSSSSNQPSSSTKRVTRSSAKAQQQGNSSSSSSSKKDNREPSTASSSDHPKKKKIKMSVHQPIVIDDSDEELEDTFFSGAEGEDLEIDDDIQAAIDASLKDQSVARAKQVGLPSPALTEEVSFGRAGWKRDYGLCRTKWGVQGEVEGYAGMNGMIKDFKSGESDDSVFYKLEYEDIDGRGFKLNLNLIFQDLKSYPASYNLVLFSHDSLPKRAEATFSRFSEIYDLEIPLLLEKLLASLQGDDEATGGIPGDFDEGEMEEDEEMIDGADPWAEDLGRGFETAKGSDGDLGPGWIQLKDHFEQAQKWGYRPGLTRVSDFWVVSYSIPLKNLLIDPNVLSMWDDGLVDAWKKDQRLILMMGTDTYPPHLDKMKYWLGFHPNYKPPLDVMVSTTRGHGMPGFYLSAPILNYLKSFGRCYKLRTAFGLNWSTADRIGMDEEASRQGLREIFPLVICLYGWKPYCLNCGLEVKLHLSDYVCDKPLCIYGFMSLGLGPSVEYTIMTHPAVVDVLLSFAHCAAASGAQTRMELPLHLHIEVPPEFGIAHSQLLDELPDLDQRRALAWLIQQLPKVSEIKAHLERGGKLKSIDAPSGSIGVLRWVVGSCRAYLKETKPGEGVQDISSASTTTPTQVTYGSMGGDLKQFTFVVGSPEQESNFKNEIELAKKENKNCKTYPTLLAFHGSAAERWHNILRTGLDFSETINGRAYGNGVYFASNSGTSMGGYARATVHVRENADFKLSKATALVELVNVPHTFVSSHPFYVVNNVKQIKPFLLLVQGNETMETSEEAEEERAKNAKSAKGALFVHDPMLRTKPTLNSNQPLAVMMPEKLTRTSYIDDEPDDKTDYDIFNPPPPPPKPQNTFKPSPQSRYARMESLPPPTETSVVASKALGKELKAVVKAQEEGGLPFWVNPDVESLYCWTLELHTFPPDSHLYKEMKKHNISSIIAELRFPASFPHSPPFMRIVHPRLMPFMYGGGGNITGGGSVCNELMTGTGWNPAFCTEAVVREVMTNMTEATPPARLDPRNWNSPYTMREAVEAYKRVAKQHNWEIPKDFDRLTV